MRLKYALTLIGSTLMSLGHEDATRAGISERQEMRYDIEPAIVIAKYTPKPTVVAAMGANYDVVYDMSDGTKITRRGGTRAWRNANPGNLRYTEFTQRMGAVGTAGGFAIFPSEEIGAEALDSLLRSDKYSRLTMGQAVMKYAPPHENDTARYLASLRKITGVHHDTKMHTLNTAQMERVVAAIRQLEGWREGIELHSKNANQKAI